MKHLSSIAIAAIALVALLFGKAVASPADDNPEIAELRKQLAPVNIDEEFGALARFFHDNNTSDSVTRVDISFDPKGYCRLASALQKLGQTAAIAELRTLAKRPDGGKVIVLCRMLFVARECGNFRAPRLGAPSGLARADGQPWPLEPIALSRGVPFLIVTGYTLNGLAETPGQYLEYCISECVWRTKALYQPHQKIIEAACTTFLIDAIPSEDQWIDKSTADFLQKQINNSARHADLKSFSSPPPCKLPPGQEPVLRGDYSSRKAALKKVLTDDFDIKSIPVEREADFYAILALFLQKRGVDEFIYAFNFYPSWDAQVSFFDGSHAGYFTYRKLAGVWALKDTFYID